MKRSTLISVSLIGIAAAAMSLGLAWIAWQWQQGGYAGQVVIAREGGREITAEDVEITTRPVIADDNTRSSVLLTLLQSGKMVGLPSEYVESIPEIAAELDPQRDQKNYDVTATIRGAEWLFVVREGRVVSAIRAKDTQR